MEFSEAVILTLKCGKSKAILKKLTPLISTAIGREMVYTKQFENSTGQNLKFLD